ncbi:MAG: putative DNA-binding domain-containing protein [Bacteroidia bacterium]
MLLQNNTKTIQSKLADYCRTGELTLTTEVNQKHVRHYRRLVYNIIDDMLQSAFPIFYEFADTEMWDEIVNTFFSTHACQTPHVWKVPGEFYQYACDKNLKEKYDLPFLDDLLLFEWIELDIHTMKDEEFPAFKIDGNWNEDVLVVNPEYRILSVKYPVHTTAPINIKKENEGQYFILMYREPKKGSVQFLDISVLYALTIEKIEEEKSIAEITDELQAIFSFEDKVFAQEQVINFCKDLQLKDFVLGFKK